MHFKKFSEILHFLKSNEITRSYVLKQVPSYISENVDQVFSTNFPLFRAISNRGAKEQLQTLSKFIQKNILQIEEKGATKASLFPGQVNFEYANLVHNFKTLNQANYLKNQALVDTLLDFAQTPKFDNTETRYFYGPSIKPTSGRPLQGLKKLMAQKDQTLGAKAEVSSTGMSYKKKYTRVMHISPRLRLIYLKRVIEMEANYPDLCKSFLSQLSSIIQKQNKDIVKDLIMQPKYLKFVGLSKSEIEDMYHEYFFSEINDSWFKKESFVDDKIFKISCEVLSFLSIKDLTKISNWEILEVHLKSSIDMLKELDITFALEHKFAILHKVLENISYLIHYVNETKILPGNEEILVVFIWCVIQAKCETMKSNFRFLLLFVDDDQKMGELGFAITQLEAAIIFIGKFANHRKYFEELADDGELRGGAAQTGGAK